MRVHVLRLHVDYYNDMASGLKSAELRYNDRGYSEGDTLHLYEWDGTEYTGRFLTRRVVRVYPMDRFGFAGWVMLAVL